MQITHLGQKIHLSYITSFAPKLYILQNNFETIYDYQTMWFQKKQSIWNDFNQSMSKHTKPIHHAESYDYVLLL